LDWPERNSTFAQDDLFAKGQDIFEELKTVIGLISDITERLEEKRSQGLIGSSFDAKIILLTNNDFRVKYLESLEGDLCEIFKISQIAIMFDPNLPNLDKCVRVITSPDIAIKVEKADGTKCVRCWNYSRSVGKNKSHPLICDRCITVLG
jgi:isoleucyl-tRNA synthetase